MNIDTKFVLLLAPLILQVLPLHAVEPDETESNITTTTIVIPRLFAFEHTGIDNPADTLFLERYDYLTGVDDDPRRDQFVDLDLSLKVNNGERDLFVLERRGFGEHNHRLDTEFNNDLLNVFADFSHYRSFTGGIDYLYRPDAPGLEGGGTGGGVPGFARTFNNDAEPLDYFIDRSSYRAGIKIKPELLADSASISVNVDGYERDGAKFAPFLLNGGNNSGQERWRAINLDVDESVSRAGFTVSASPFRKFEVAYQAALEQFDNDAAELQLQADVLDPAGLLLPDNTSPLASLFYVPDTELLSQSIRFSKNFSDRMLLAAGYGATLLRQESFSRYEVINNHDEGEINTRNAYLSLSGRLGASLSLEAYFKTSERDNDSTFPDGLLSLTPPVTVVAPRIDRIESRDAGVSAHWRADALNSRFTFGWRGLDKDRDLTFGIVGQSIAPGQTLYREQTQSNEIYLKWRARPARGWNLRVTPAYTEADQTGLVSEPGTAVSVKTMLSYTSPDGWLFNGFYDYKKRQNDNNEFIDGDGSDSLYQDVDQITQAAGLGWNLKPRHDIDTHINMFWTQDDFTSYLFRSSLVRWNPAVEFLLEEQPNYLIDSHVWNFGADWRLSERLALNANYSFTKSSGHVVSGNLQDSLEAVTGSIDTEIDSTLHSIALGADYKTGKRSRLEFGYYYDRYQDNAYEVLSGDLHLLTVGFAVEF